MSFDWLAIPFGLGLILLSLADVFLTVLHVQVESPISNRINRRLWRILLCITKRLPKTARDEVLGWGAPLMIGGIIAFWVVLYVVGFALLYLPVIHDPQVFSLSGVAPTWPIGDALYFSAVSFLTIGYGDIVPIHPLVRLLGFLEGALGLLTISLSVTYLLSIYPFITRKTSLAISLNQEAAGRSDGVVIAERYVRDGRFDALGERLRSLNDELLTMGQAHGLYPILYYVRPREVHESFVRVLTVVQGVVATLRYGLDPDRHREIVTDPRLLILEEGLLATLHTLAESSHLAPDEVAARDVSEEDHLALLDELTARGVAAVRRHEDSACREYVRFRSATDRYIDAYARNAGYDPASARAIYSRWARDTALVGHAEAHASSRVAS